MSIGKIRSATCSEEDLDGKYILPSGVLKITAQIKGEIDVIEAAAPAVITVRVLHQQTNNPRFLFAEDPDTRQKNRRVNTRAAQRYYQSSRKAPKS